MNQSELCEMVDVIIQDRVSTLGRPHELMDSLVRKTLPGECFSIIEPLLSSKHRLVRNRQLTSLEN